VTHRPWPKGWWPLVEAALEALPRSKGRPRRASVLQDEDGIVHCGVSIQIPALPAASLCAEQVATTSMCASGACVPLRMVTISSRDPGPPCGRCLQLLLEFGDEVEIRWGTPQQQWGQSTLERLLPMAFRDFRGH
jgi:cytidine deaminase